MQRSTLPPAHPSLPRHPTAQTPTPPIQIYQTNPTYPAYYNSHYLQAYSQSIPTNLHQSNSSYASQASSAGRGPSFSHHNMNSWYQSGNNRCVHPGCIFTGSQKTVELHMMDRHLIYPAGWEKRKKKNDWDGDPSLKGKPIPIQGTNIVLDSPEVLEAWIAERKRRFPTSDRVADKKRKMSEAVARGQLDLADNGVRANKRRKTDNQDRPQKERSARHPGGPEKNFESSRVPDSGWGARSKVKEAAPVVPKHVIQQNISPRSDSDSGDDDQPEAVSSKIAPPIELSPPTPEPEAVSQVDSPVAPALGTEKEPERHMKPQAQQPKMPPKNPFASRPTLLRNLLLPEIRITISNLSQAIRFLVDNDFLQNVELKPGQACENNKIQVLGQGDAKAGSPNPDVISP